MQNIMIIKYSIFYRKLQFLSAFQLFKDPGLPRFPRKDGKKQSSRENSQEFSWRSSLYRSCRLKSASYERKKYLYLLSRKAEKLKSLTTADHFAALVMTDKDDYDILRIRLSLLLR